MLATKNRIKKYLGLTIFIVLFSLIYEHFSFGVVSYFMVLAFVFPLVLVLISCLELYLKKEINNDFISASMVTLMIGFIINGVLEIYGTTNTLINYYWVLGVLLLLIGVIRHK